MTLDQAPASAKEDGGRDRAVQRLKKRRDFRAHLLVYVLVNATIVAVWALTSRHGFFWPVFPILAWGIGVVMNAWDVYHDEDFTDAQIDREIARMRSRR
jgi:2TM domain